MDFKRTLLAVVLSLGVVFLWQTYVAPKPKVEAPGAAAATSAPSAQALPSAAPSAQGAPAASAPAVAAASPAPMAVVPLTRNTLANDAITLTLSNRGAVIEDARLADYMDKAGKEGKPLELLPSGQDVVGTTRLALVLPSTELSYRVEEANSDHIRYLWESPEGIRVEKTYTLPTGKRYDVRLDITVSNARSTPIRDRLTVGLVRDYSSTSSAYTFHGPGYLKGDDLEEVKPKKVKEGLSEAEGVAWAGMAENYFLLATVPQEPARTGVRIARHEGMETVAEVEITPPEFEIPSGGKTTYTANLYLGPKHEGTMAPLGMRLEEPIKYGWFGAIGKWFLLVLNVIYRFVGNYGVAIIILTTLVKLALWPLSAKSIQSMSRMRELQPKVAKLKERYGKDPAKLNAEVMQLYKTHKVNPLGGCLPMLLQIPVFFALYRVLLSSIELRHAPFVFWITDLSVKDPYYVTPLVM
ncbi:MAG TPA: membrane protein insertase YidC, partial [Geobacteraceae bacterium]